VSILFFITIFISGILEGVTIPTPSPHKVTINLFMLSYKNSYYTHNHTPYKGVWIEFPILDCILSHCDFYFIYFLPLKLIKSKKSLKLRGNTLFRFLLNIYIIIQSIKRSQSNLFKIKNQTTISYILL